MAPLVSFSFILMFLMLCIGLPAFAEARFSGSTASIESYCKATRYQSLCVKYLSYYANATALRTPAEIVQAALTVSLYRARHTRAYMLKAADEIKSNKAHRDYQAVKDCLTQISDGVEQLSQSIRELRRLQDNGHSLGQQDVFWHVSNVETWMSSAITDANTCADQFPRRNMSKFKAIIKGKVLNVQQVTSNALAIFHRYAAKYKAARSATKKP